MSLSLKRAPRFLSLQDDALSSALVLSPALLPPLQESSSLPCESSGDTADSLPARARLLPLQLEIRIPLASFRVRDLLSLASGAVLETEWPASEDLPLGSGDVQLVWAEFEVVDQKLAARITRLA